jgi:hypothetical protein
VCAQPLDQLPRALLLERLGDGPGEHRADPWHLLYLRRARCQQGVHRAEVVRDRAGVHVADAGNAESVEHAHEGLLLGPLDRGHQVARRHLAEALELRQPVGGQPVDVRHARDQPLVEEAAHVLLPEAVDVHRAYEVLDGLE